jgi:hypothetical protein
VQTRMSPLPRVFAYRDYEPTIELARWAPRKVYCTERADHADQPGVLFVVKFCQGRQGAAAMVSEVVCRTLLLCGGLRVLDAVTVFASADFSASWNANSSRPYPIASGLYFGTRYRDDVESGPPTRVNMVHNVGEIVDLWAFDSWFCNLDRNTEGNVLLQPSGDGQTFRLIAADQSDCFCGSGAFSSQEWRLRMGARPNSEGFFVADAIGLSGGRRRVRSAIQKVSVAFEHLDEAFDNVPTEWWTASGIDPGHIRIELQNRLDRLAQILRVDQWGDIDNEQFANIPII